MLELAVAHCDGGRGKAGGGIRDHTRRAGDEVPKIRNPLNGPAQELMPYTGAYTVHIRLSYDPASSQVIARRQHCAAVA